jgi:hypothetical protein
LNFVTSMLTCIGVCVSSQQQHMLHCVNILQL